MGRRENGREREGKERKGEEGQKVKTPRPTSTNPAYKLPV